MAKASRFDEKVIVVALDEIAAMVGNHEVCGYWIRKIGAEIVEDWQGRPSLRVIDARRVVEARHADKAKHDAEWEAYQVFLRERKEQARQAREDELRQHRAEVEKARDASRRKWAERVLQDRQAELAAEAERENAKSQPSFTEWKVTHGGAA